MVHEKVSTTDLGIALMRNRPQRTRWLFLVLLLCSDCRNTRPNYLDIATTTSVQNSGLLETLLPHFQPATVRIHAVGSGLALKMLSDQTVGLAISHAPDTEERYLAEHSDWVYRKVAFNHFLLIGPRDDPAHVRGAADVLDAFRRIAASGATFVSRGDQSGTDEREKLLWKSAGIGLSPERRLISGAGMAVTLRHADEKQAYTLSDDATFWQLEPRLREVVLFSEDARLVNSYAVLFPSNSALAAAFAVWLTRGEGHDRLSAYRIRDHVAFSVWPLGCRSDTPDAQPCGPSRE
jgi:tungstate transport system substrate-binding protein